MLCHLPWSRYHFWKFELKENYMTFTVTLIRPWHNVSTGPSKTKSKYLYRLSLPIIDPSIRRLNTPQMYLSLSRSNLILCKSIKILVGLVWLLETAFSVSAGALARSTGSLSAVFEQASEATGRFHHSSALQLRTQHQALASRCGPSLWARRPLTSEAQPRLQRND